MPNNSTKILFLMTLISGVLISLCANSWMGAWIGLEINLLSFIPMLSSNKNMFSSEASLKYFLVQAIASSSLLFFILLKTNFYEMSNIMKNSMWWNNLIMIPLLMKIACAPFHWWFPSVIEGLTWINCFIILTIQKIAPLVLISYMLTNSYFTHSLIILSVTLGAIGGFNQVSTRKILAFSSIAHAGWMLVTMIMGMSLWLMYFLVYIMNITSIILMTSMNNIHYISQSFKIMNHKKMIKITLFISMLSLGGLPPLLGFFPKWIVINIMVLNSFIFTAFILIISSMITLFYYMRIIYATLMIMNVETTWSVGIKPKESHSKMTMFSTYILLLGMWINTLILLVVC
uniref:NADH dehydrogenase subunit 2 n=1 Tax=Theopropus sinecus TaxID=2908872 RepID=UPI003002F36E